MAVKIKQEEEEYEFSAFDDLQSYAINLAELLAIISDSNASGKYALEEKITSEIDNVIDILIELRHDKARVR